MTYQCIITAVSPQPTKAALIQEQHLSSCVWITHFQVQTFLHGARKALRWEARLASVTFNDVRGAHTLTIHLLTCNLHSTQEALLLPAQLCACPVQICFLQKPPPLTAELHRDMGSLLSSSVVTEIFVCLSSSFPSSHSYMSLSLETKHESVGNYSQLDDCISCQPKYQDCVNTQILFTNQAVRKLGSKRRHLCVFCATNSHNRLPKTACFFGQWATVIYENDLLDTCI